MPPDTQPKADTTCPACGVKGKPVKPVTIRSLVDPVVCRKLTSPQGLRFCPTPGCPVSYFNNATGETITCADVTVRIGQKVTDPPRPVCYCFGHTDESIRDEVAATGKSTVFDEIKAKCRQGLDRCAETNPQGACCLANVRAAIEAAQTDLGVAVDPSADPPADCCSATCCNETNEDAREARRGGAGFWAAGGAVVTAVLASACCWLPLLLISLGVSAAGVGGFFEAYRPYLLGVTALLLGLGFYLAYRKPRCAPGSACAADSARPGRFNKAVLGFAALAVLVFALFPNYLVLFMGGGEAASAGPPTDAAVVDGRDAGGPVTSRARLDIEGMTCPACAVGLTAHLNALPGVRHAAVDYQTRSADVQLDGSADIDAVLQAISDYGYQGQVRQTP